MYFNRVRDIKKMASNMGPANERLNSVSNDLSTVALSICPYDSSHRILPHRMQTHLKKCMDQHFKAKGFVICPFNFTHHMTPDVMPKHLQICSDRHKADCFLFTTGNTSDAAKQRSRKPIVDMPQHEPEEDWDADGDSPTYDPIKANRDNPMLLCLKGSSKSKRKNFQQEQRKRNSRILNGEKPR